MNRRQFISAAVLAAVGLKLGPRPSKWAWGIDPRPLPSGILMHYVGPRVPAGWVPCDGRTLRRRDYPALAAAVGRAYGGDGVTTFRVPDLRDRPLAQARLLIRT